MADVKGVVRFIARSGKRVAVGVAGFALLAAGIVMLVVPGPGLLTIVAGLALLATEFAWAERTLEQTKRRAASAAERVRGRKGPA